MESTEAPGLLRYVLGYLLVGCAWGLTTPFMRKAALEKQQTQPSIPPNSSWLTSQYLSIWYAVLNLIQRPSYTIPLLLNLSGSVVFFIIVGQAGPSS
jgi:hypothetical protein